LIKDKSVTATVTFANIANIFQNVINLKRDKWRGLTMKIGIIGASGKVGQLVLKEALDRGHQVTAIVRNASKITNTEVEVIEKDIASFEVVVNAFGAPLGDSEGHINAGRHLIDILKGTDTRAIIVGGAGSLYIDDAHTVQLIDTPEFPDIVKPTASGQGQNLKELRNSEGITWTFLSPAAEFDPEGVRTGHYQSGKDQLIVDSEGNSYISYADYAVALVDEIENPQHINERFTVVGEAK
jgi:putative NADH-flavin reductase